MKPLRSKTSPTESEAPARPTLLPLKMEHVPPAHLKESSRNARTHSKGQIRQVADSVREFGWSVPIIADEDGVVIAGHARLEAAKFIGLRRVPVVTVAGLSEAKKRALALAGVAVPGLHPLLGEILVQQGALPREHLEAVLDRQATAF